MKKSLQKHRAVFGAAAGAVLVGAAIAAWSSARTRRRRLRRGQLRELRSHWALVHRRRMHFRASAGSDAPRGVPVVLIHGFGISSSYFVPLGERLATEFDVYAPDLPGHGKSDTPQQPLDIPGLADALVKWMDAIELRPVALVANSMGCQVAVDAAVRYPGRFDRLVLIGPTVDPSARTVAQHAWRLLIGGLHERASLTALLIVDYVRMGRRLIPELRFMLRDRIENKLPHVTVPVLLIRGQYDSIAPRRWLNHAARQLHTTRVIIIPGWGHAAHYSAAQQVADLVAPFLREAANVRTEPLTSHPAIEVPPSRD